MYLISNNHTGLNAVRITVFADAKWQRCQFHLTQNAKKQAPNKQIKIWIAKDLRLVCDAENLGQADNVFKNIFDKYSEIAQILVCWLENNVPEA